VGILGAALYSPVWTSAVLKPEDFALAVAGFVLLTAWKTQPFFVALVMGCGGSLMALWQ
jgi:chromate transporter